MVERHQDYQLTIPTLPVGGLTNVPLQLDTDAPFALRLVRSRNLVVDGVPQLWRFQTPRRQYQSSTFRTDYVFSSSLGFLPGRGVTIYPQMIFPVGSSIVVDIQNTTGAPITNAKLLFRGSKLFRDGAIAAPTYPARIAPLPFIYQTIVQNVPLTGPPITDNQLRVKNDADFVFRYGVCDAFHLSVDGQRGASPFGAIPPQFTDVFVTLKDESRKAYSNEPIHVNDLFGSGSPNSFGTPTDNDPTVAWFPGLYTPEIYVPRDHSLYFDVFRNEGPGANGGNTPCDLWFRFCGMKAFTA